MQGGSVLERVRLPSYLAIMKKLLLFFLSFALLAVGCRDNGPKRASVAPLPNMFPSLKELAAAVVQAVADSNEQLLRDFVVTESEYRDVVWVNLDTSETRQLPFDMSWGWNVRDTNISILRYLESYGGHDLQLTRINPPAEVRLRNQIRVHRGTVIFVADGRGDEEAWRILNVVLEYQGWYKVITYHD
jgi:hypothetical protein